MNAVAQRFTLAQATALDAALWDGFSREELILTEDERDRTASVWLRLRGVEPGSDDASSLRQEVLTDGGLIVALNVPAAEFLGWFRRCDWACFDETERSGSEAWVWALMQRASAACEAMGPLATQHSLTCWRVA